MTAPTVFISYSHDSTEHANRVLKLADRLVSEGIDVILDQYEPAPPEGWPRWMDKHIRDADFVLMVCTETYYRRVMGEEKTGEGLGIKWEGNLIYQHIYQANTTNSRFIPVLFEYSKVEHIPTPLQGVTRHRVDTPDGYEDLYRQITNQPRVTKPKLGKLKSLPPRERKPDYLGIKISLAKLPSTSPDLFGREKELKELDDAWANPQINVVSLVAWGGVGKSALVNKWLSGLGESYRGAERVFGWSFYSQGAAEGRQVSADQFIAAALAWFGDPDPNLGSPWDKGERLAELVKQARTLIILDGLEPLQNPPPVETGRIKDPALVAFLRELASQNLGLVVITTRLAVDDLKQYVVASPEGAKQSPRESGIASAGERRLAMTGSVIERDLDNLSPAAGAAYLSHLGVDGTEAERQDAARDFGGHALALTLVGSYLKVVHGGDIRKHHEIPHLTDDQKQGVHARRVLESYERWLKGKPELDILRLMGLFDRPAEKGALDALRKEPAIAGLTDALQKLSDADWKFAVNNLRDLRLIAEQDLHEPDTLDCHPLLREHFGEKLKSENRDAWREGNNRLYEYYKSIAKELPDTFEEMMPLFAAVGHGCQAGKYQEAYDEVYRKRIRRENEYFNIKKLGAIGTDLAVLSSFFDPPWYQIFADFRETSKNIVFATVGFDLRALGRLAEAAQPTQASLDVYIVQKDWMNAARLANNLSELTLTLGDVMQSLAYAEQSVQLSDRSGDAFEQWSNRPTFADALHQAGRLAEAQATFRDAEKMLAKSEPQFPLLYGLACYRYCDLLLSQGNYAEVERRAQKALEIVLQGSRNLQDIALNNLSLGRALALSPGPSPEIGRGESAGRGEGDESLTYLNRAVNGLRQAGRGDMLPLGLLARAEYYRVTGALEKCQRDLDEAFGVASRGGMGLFVADCHLEYARLSLARGMAVDGGRGAALLRPHTDEAREHVKTAKEMIAKMGYHRRDKEVEELESRLTDE